MKSICEDLSGEHFAELLREIDLDPIAAGERVCGCLTELSMRIVLEAPTCTEAAKEAVLLEDAAAIVKRRVRDIA